MEGKSEKTYSQAYTDAEQKNPKGLQRLRVEFEKIQKGGELKAELVNGDLYLWQLSIKFDEKESAFGQSLKSVTGQSYVTFWLEFSSAYPISPPRVGVKWPRLKAGRSFIMNGGAVCCNLLFDGGWSAALRIEAMAVAVKSLMLDPNHEVAIDPQQFHTGYTLDEVRSSAKWLQQHHSDWNQLPSALVSQDKKRKADDVIDKELLKRARI